jgi:uncharacterized protein YjbI with pentapeptide repeats
VDADLTNADLRSANLAGANLMNARIAGANFTGALISGAHLRGVDVRKAKGLDAAQTAAGGQAGPHLRKLDKLLGASLKDLKFSVILDGPDGATELIGQHRRMNAEPGGFMLWGRSFRDFLFEETRRWARSKPRLESITVEMKRWPMPQAEIHALLVAAWCEAFGLAVPSAEEIAALGTAKMDKEGGLLAAMLAELHRGSKGIAAWSKRPKAERDRLCGKIDLSGVNLGAVELSRHDLRGANFNEAGLAKAKLGAARFDGATFRNADLPEVDAWTSHFEAADFQGANLAKAKLFECSFRMANLRGTDLTGANLSMADLRGADLTSAKLDNVDFSYATFDEQTRFPVPAFMIPKQIKWAGVSVDPRKQGKTPTPTTSFDTFVVGLSTKVEVDRLKKALKMLKADRFRLYAQVDEKAVTGVVKSQSDADLVYSCRLGADGAFGCCTQNLNVCGGLRGSLCKHLLVLIVGLAKSGELDDATVSTWIEASRKQKAVLDKDAMSDTFIRYKGAEAGEVDWRPTETIPEDYYAL